MYEQITFSFTPLSHSILKMYSFDSYRDSFQEQYQALLDKLVFPEISTTTYCIATLVICLPPIIALIIYEREQARLLAEQPTGCRKLGMNIETNLANEYEQKFSEGRPPSTEETSAEWWRLKSLWIYPIKSCRGVELNRGTICATGMHYDRQFAFAQLRSPFPVALQTSEKEKTDHRWEVITQKNFPRLANIRTEMWVPDQSVKSYTPHAEDVESGGVIVISFPWQKSDWRGTVAKWGAAVKGTVPEKQFRVPFNPTPAQVEKIGYSHEKLSIWNDTITALNMEIEIPEELRYYLGISNKLGLFRTDTTKPINTTPENLNGGDSMSTRIVGFQDAYPVHLVNLATIRDIESKMVKTASTPRLSAASFRANLIITGPEPYHENCWRRIKIGFYEYDAINRTSRIKPIEDSKDTQKRSDDTWNRVINEYRTEEKGPGLDVVDLGIQMAPLSGDSALRVGDEITILEVDAQSSFD
ncbi:putative mosc domain-containing protein [Golovinomyces cichoracearum]|uniref:Putative mosc domain-containing protein n=1 Tax=Golovinomyces cichoracearum TaxID=62708 RepID=A0A420IRI2_9PEZI|nr:putative mosc domain-containing protein [Golovinomyces cichoracearum]